MAKGKRLSEDDIQWIKYACHELHWVQEKIATHLRINLSTVSRHSRQMIDNSEIQKAFLESGCSATEVARYLDWWNRSEGHPKRLPDASRVRRTLGITPEKGRYRRRINVTQAKQICEAIHIDPFDVGL